MGRVSLCIVFFVSLLGVTIGVPFGEVVTNVTSSYAYLNEHGYDLTAADVECAQWNSGESFEWRSRYEWTGFCVPDEPQGEEACGRCLKVINLGTGAQTTVRIVDTCGSGGLDLDFKPFRLIDTNGNGYQQGHLTVSYEFVECGDEPTLMSMVA